MKQVTKLDFVPQTEAMLCNLREHPENTICCGHIQGDPVPEIYQRIYKVRPTYWSGDNMTGILWKDNRLDMGHLEIHNSDHKLIGQYSVSGFNKAKAFLQKIDDPDRKKRYYQLTVSGYPIGGGYGGFNTDEPIETIVALQTRAEIIRNDSYEEVHFAFLGCDYEQARKKLVEE